MSYLLVDSTLVVNSRSTGRYLYVLSPAASSINVFSLKKGGSKLIQTYDFGKATGKLKFDGVNLAGADTYVI